VAAPSVRLLTLGELATSDESVLEALLRENETLFLEQKSGIEKGDGYQLAKATASFANTLGGWVLVGAKDGKLVPGWEPPNGGFVDAVRQRLEGQLDPLPPFAAEVLPCGAGKLGVVRVYESTDTPHILRASGSVVVREPAQDANLRKAGQYEATPIRSHYELSRLMERGRRAEEAAVDRFGRGALPFLEGALRFRWTQAARLNETLEWVTGDTPALIVRAAPLNLSARWREWAVSETGVAAVTRIVEAISEDDADKEDPVPHPTGVAVSARGRKRTKWVANGHRSLLRQSTAAIDGGGVIGVRLGFDTQKDGGNLYDWRGLSDDGALEDLVRPLV
jgi:hypothetical protein